jgi:WD40 repeat protein
VQNGQHYLVMNLIEGPNLAQLIKERPLPVQLVAECLKTVAEAVHYAHERGLLHRDSKPSNILMDAGGQPHVTDFGLARRFDGDSSLTLTDQVLGSPGYMPPEQADAVRGKVGRRSDVYSLGAMLYDLLAGRPPFVGETMNETLDQVFHREPLSPRLLDAGIPRDLETICLKCLEKEPARRYATAQALADELERFLNHEPIPARPIRAPEKLWRWCRRKPALAIALLLLQVALVSGLAGILWQWRRAEQHLYVGNVHLAHEALEGRDLARTRSLLQSIAESRVQRSLRGWEWRYLAGRARGDQLAILDQQASRVWGLAASPDGQWLASINGDGLVTLWDFAARRKTNSWPTMPAPLAARLDDAFRSLVFTPDGTSLITTGPNNGVVCWEIPTGRNRWETPRLAHRSEILAISRDGRRLAVGNRYRSQSGEQLSLLDLTGDSPSLLLNWKPGMTVLFDLAVAADGATLLAGGPDAQLVRRYDLSSPNEPLRLSDLEDSDGPLAFSPDGRWIATARTYGQGVCVREFPSLNRVATHSVRGSQFRTLAFSPDDQMLAGGLQDSQILIWSSPLTDEPAALLGPEKIVMQLVFSADGRTLASASFDHTVRLWDVATGDGATWAVRLNGSGHDVNFSPDSRRLVSVSHVTVDSGTNEPQRLRIVQIWDVDGRFGLVPRASQTNAAADLNFQASFSPDGSLIAADDYGALRYLAVPDLREIAQAGSRRVCWPRDGRWLVFVDAESKGIVRADSLHSTSRTFLAPGNPMALAPSPDGRMLASAGHAAEWKIELRDARDGRRLGPPLRGHEGEVSALAFSPDGTTLATCGSDDTVWLWNLALKREVAALHGHRGDVKGVAFSPDGHWLASASSDGTLRLWRAPLLEELGLAGRAE